MKDLFKEMVFKKSAKTMKNDSKLFENAIELQNSIKNDNIFGISASSVLHVFNQLLILKIIICFNTMVKFFVFEKKE